MSPGFELFEIIRFTLNLELFLSEWIIRFLRLLPVPDINIEMENKDQNPHWTKLSDANNKYLGFTKYDNSKDNLTSHAKEWDKDFEIDLIGREYCRDRAIACSKI